MIILDGKQTSEKILNNVKEEINNLPHIPKLVVISVGEDQASKVYIRNKCNACNKVGINFEEIHIDNKGLSSKELFKKLYDEILKLDTDPSVNGILIQKPIIGLDKDHEETLFLTINPFKDVDVFNLSNTIEIYQRENKLLPCTPKGILTLLDEYKIDVEGKNVVIIGRSNIVGKPLALALLNKNATVTICHSKTVGLQDICKTADILISAVGKPKFITRDFIGFDTNVIIDVGINRDENNKLCGDVDFEDVVELFGDMSTNNYITPVPGGVGAMTVASLIENTIDLTHKQFLKEIS